jgi:UDP-2-acetamido-2-deoxy-ribo-hexuluronate aminotransferase
MTQVLKQPHKIQMVDLASQHRPYQLELNEAIATVQQHGAFINGPEVKAFAQNLAAYLQAKHVIPCANGTDAIQIALMALDLKPGDEMLTTSFNYVAAAEAAALLGLKPVFVEVEEGTFNIDLNDLEAKLSPKTKVLIAVHLFGQGCDMEGIMALANKHGIFVIEDTAQSLGCDITYQGERRKAGTIGHIGTTSFFPTKNLGCMGDGGAIYTQDDILAEKCKSISAHGQGQRYEFKQIGVNSRLDTLQAAILDVKLKHLIPALEKRAYWAKAYRQALSGISDLELPALSSYATHSYNQFTLKVRNGQRDALKQSLADAGIPSMVYYPKPLHLQPAFAFLGYASGLLPVSESLCHEVLSLPIHPELSEEQVAYIAEKITLFARQ